jgi:hypothetical protein
MRKLTRRSRRHRFRPRYSDGKPRPDPLNQLVKIFDQIVPTAQRGLVSDTFSYEVLDEKEHHDKPNG